jgi:hypothetical protein
MVYSATLPDTDTAPALMTPSAVRTVHVPELGAVRVAPAKTGHVMVLFRLRSMA